MVDPARIQDKLHIVRVAANRLKALSQLSREEFVSCPDHFAIAEHHLRRALEALFDLARHLSVKMGWGRPKTYREAIVFITQNGVLDSAFAASIQGMAGYRKRLVHDYDRVTADEMCTILATRLDDLETFAAAIVQFLDQPRD